MNSAEVLTELFRVTGALDPVSPATYEDLDDLRWRLAHSLFDQPSSGVPPWVPSSEEFRDTVGLLQQVVAQAVAERSSGTGPPRSRLFRRELPGRGAHQGASFPARTGGHHTARTFGPMLEAKERLVYYDLIEAIDFVRVERRPRTVPFLHLPADAVSDGDRRYTFGRGSVWIEAATLAAGAHGFTGLRVSSGTLTFEDPPQRLGDRLVTHAHAHCLLTLTLDAPAVPSPTTGPGQDAGQATAIRPTVAEFHFSHAGAYLINADGGGLEVFGAAVTLTPGQEEAVWEDLTDGVLVPYRPDQSEVTPSGVRSNLLRPEGTWRVHAGGWLLPTSLVTDSNELGEAADIGAMALVVDKGMHATWPGLEAGGYTASRAVVAVDSRELAIACDGATPPIARQELTLWRGASIELRYRGRFRLQFVSSRAGVDVLAVRARLDAHLDPPRQADGTPTHVEIPQACVCISDTDTRTWIHLVGEREPEQERLAPLALQNALLMTTPPLDLDAVGLLIDAARIEGAGLRLTYGLRGIIPFLPDPYAAGFDPMRRPDLQPGGRVTAVFTWSGATFPAAARLLVSGATPDEDALLGLLPIGRPLFDDEVDGELGRRLEQTLRVERTHPPLVMLDLSGNADQWGLGTAFGVDRRTRPPVSVSETSLVADASELRAVALPQVSWEPVRTHPDDLEPGFPDPLASRDDGGPLVLGVSDDSVHLTPLAPEPLLRNLVSLAGRDTARAAIRFTLPFGIKAVASVPATDGQHAPGERPQLNLTAPLFGPYTGGLQVSLDAATSRGLPGVAIQTQHSVDGSHNVLGSVVDGFFNAAFGAGGHVGRVPVTRVDFSGYGASTFSTWTNDDAGPVDVTKVEFGVMTGRAHYEVVEIQSILWPCMAKVVRRITIRREGHGTVVRRDSGWVAATPGLFHRPDSDCVFHPGVVRGMFQIREIRETSRRVTIGSGVELQAVYFDTDIGFENLDRGQACEMTGPHGRPIGLVPAQRQLGFVQLISPNAAQQTPLNSSQLAALLNRYGPVGGPVDCELHIGDSLQRMRVANVRAEVAGSTGGPVEFALAAYGTPALPREGQWSVVRMRKVASSERCKRLDEVGAVSGS
ncbi:hypothetical protein [Nonomuraea ceibae]|uniref:hypothetical protein n=1 Tax=Nonomuraea ceibae TaxID=1935170 RepID=UPI001C5EBA81|nr:hypothetical protein [Nonomuraea ceibae]